MSHAYVANDRTHALPLEHDFLAVRYHEGASHRQRSAAAKRAGLAAWRERVELPGERFTLHGVAPGPATREKRHAAALARAAAHPHVARVAPVFRKGGAHVIATDRVIVGLRPGADAAAAFAGFEARIVERHGDELLLELHHADDPFEACARLCALDGVVFAEPDFLTMGHRAPRQSAGPTGGAAAARPKQYALALTRARDAWKLQRGDPGIRIAIIDEGVQTRHPCLARAIVATYDATTDQPTQDPRPWDAHGTGCAGLAAAAGRSAKGVAAGCSLMTARLGYSPTKGGKFVTKQWWVKRAVDWAWKSGADVLSNSWGGVPESTLITRAIERARARGRGGKGCVVVAAAGNDEVLGGKVEFPGTLPEVLTVAASNEWDEPKTIQSRDNERWWGSSFGPEVDLAAPGVDNYTTDNVGAPGYTRTSYVPDFNGTSSATPIVAGAAALVLCANPELTEAEVRKILCDTADKVGPIPYVDGRNDHMGHGRLNVLEAVRAARTPAVKERP